MDIMQKASDLFASKLQDANIAGNVDKLQSVIGNLFGGDEKQGIDLGSIVDKLKNSGLGNIADSWLGDGENEHISKSQLESVIDTSKLNAAAEQLGAKKDELLAGLQKMLPQVVDMSSRGGEILDSVREEFVDFTKRFQK